MSGRIKTFLSEIATCISFLSKLSPRAHITSDFLMVTSIDDDDTIDMDLLGTDGTTLEYEQGSDVETDFHSVTLSETKPERFPWVTVLSACVALISDGMSIAYCITYATALVVNQYGVEENNAGYFVGWITAAYYLGQVCSTYFLGWYSDKKGRRSVILCSVLTNAVIMAFYGTCPWLWMVIVLRFLNGLCSATLPLTRCVIREACTEKNQALGFALREVAYSIGAILGPLVGSLFARPADRAFLQGTFFTSEFFVKYPYALSDYALSLIFFLILIITFIWLPETLRPKKPQTLAQELDDVPLASVKLLSDYSDEVIDLGVDPSLQGTEPEIKPEGNSRCPSSLSWITRGVFIGAFLYAMDAYISITIIQVFPVWATRDSESDGLNFTDREVGLVNSCGAILPVLFQLFCFSSLDKLLGSAIGFRTAMCKCSTAQLISVY